jgi:UPF0271 protein
VFADRTYQPDGSLTPRSHADALIGSVDDSLIQVLRIVKDGSVDAVDGEPVKVDADTRCLHGDGEHAVEFARAIRKGLAEHGIAVAPISR